VPKIKITIFAEKEYEPTPEWYPGGSTLEDIVEIDRRACIDNPEEFVAGADLVTVNAQVINDETYSKEIMEALRQRRDLEPDDTSEDAEIMATGKRKAFSEFLKWNNLGDWGKSILDRVEEMFQVNLED
jgi:hypothetical protein